MKLLSIVIPTYNRANYLDNQIKWVVAEGEMFWNDIELLVLDNSSTDETPKVCSGWIESLGDKIRVIRNDTNIGLVLNCLKGIDSANSDFVWLIGDDDPIEKGLLSKILPILKTHKDSLHLLHLNHRCVAGYQGKVIIDSFYSEKKDIYAGMDSYDLVNKLLKDTNTGGFMFITANILNKNKAMEIITSSDKKHSRLLAYPMYLYVKLACTGGFYYYADINLTCIYNESSWSKESDDIHYFQLPFFWMKLKKNGLSKKKIEGWLKKDIPHKPVELLRFFYHNMKKVTPVFKMIAIKIRIGLWRVFQ